MFDSNIGRRACIVYREGEETKTILGVLEKTDNNNFLQVSTDYGHNFLININSIIKVKIKNGDGGAQDGR